MIITVGMAVFGYDELIFKSSLLSCYSLSDEIFMVYGRFKGFDLPYIELSTDIQAILKTLQVQMHFCDNIHTQPKQRDLYLPIGSDKPILFVIDPDEVPILGMGADGLRQYLAGTRCDSYAVEAYSPAGLYDSTRITAYRYREGYRHGPGQVLQDEEGKLICSPHYKAVKVPYEIFHLIHYKSRKPRGYRAAQRRYWDGLKEVSR